jgi:hypothetical protein
MARIRDEDWKAAALEGVAQGRARAGREKDALAPAVQPISVSITP